MEGTANTRIKRPWRRVEAGSYRLGDAGVVRRTWRERSQAITSGRASYATSRRIKGWYVYVSGRYVGRAYRLEDAKVLAEDELARAINECFDCKEQIPTNICGTAKDEEGKQVGLLCLDCKEARDPGAAKRAFDHPNIGLEVVKVSGPVGEAL